MSKPKAYDRLISGLGLLVFLSGLQNAELVRDDELDDMGNSTMYMPCFPIPTTFDVGGVEGERVRSMAANLLSRSYF